MSARHVPEKEPTTFDNMNDLTLRFTDARLEQEFNAAAFPSELRQGRVAFTIAAILYLAFNIIDIWHAPPEDVTTLTLVRLFFVSVAFGIVGYSYHRSFIHVSALMFGLTGLLAGLGLLATFTFIDADAMAYYYPGLILVTFYTYNFVGTRYLYALVIDLLLLTLYNVLAFHWGHPTYLVLTHDFYLICANMVGATLGYMTERNRRALFLRERQLEQAKQTAETASMAKSKVMAAASHDLRQPLQALNLFLYGLNRREHDAQSREIINQIGNSSKALDELLSTLLDISRLEADVVEPKKQHLNLGTLLNRLGDEFQHIANDQKLQFEVMASDQNTFTDPVLLENILRNLLSNAIRHTHSGKVTLSCQEVDGQLRVEIRDTGPGISPEHLEHIFQEFYQIENPERDRRKGLGLGLSIVRKTSELLGLDVHVDTVLGKGTAFSLDLPKANDAPKAQATEIIQSETTPLPHNAYILVIEDDADVRDGLITLLESWGFTVLGVPCLGRNDPKQCKACLRCEPLFEVDAAIPDLILADYNLLGGLTGIHAVEVLHNLFQTDIPSVMLTGNTSTEVLQEVQAQGFPVLHKPINGEQLFKEISRALNPIVV